MATICLDLNELTHGVAANIRHFAKDIFKRISWMISIIH